MSKPVVISEALAAVGALSILAALVDGAPLGAEAALGVIMLVFLVGAVAVVAATIRSAHQLAHRT